MLWASSADWPASMHDDEMRWRRGRACDYAGKYERERERERERRRIHERDRERQQHVR